MPTNTLITQFTAAILGLGLNEAAYMAEIVRAGIGSVDRGQTEAAQALGMSPLTTYRRVVLPQAGRLIVPPTANEAISMLKLTSLCLVIGLPELHHHGPADLRPQLPADPAPHRGQHLVPRADDAR